MTQGTNPPRRRPASSGGNAGAGAGNGTPRRPSTTGASQGVRRSAPSAAAAPRPPPPVVAEEPAPTGAPGAKLVATAGPMAGSEFPLDADELVVGRANDATISIPDTSVSRKHLKVRRVGGGWAVTDLGSGNGTDVNGQRINEETPLRNGDVLTLGDTELSFVDSGNTTGRHALPVRPSSAARPPVSRDGLRRSSTSVRPRTSRTMQADPEALKRKKKIQLAVVLGALVVVGTIGALKLHKDKTLAAQQRIEAIKMQKLAHVSEIFQEGTRLVREGDWVEAQKRFLDVLDVAPDFTGLRDYLDRAKKEIPNQQHLGEAEAALKLGRLGDAADALAKVTPDTQLYEPLSRDKADLEAKVPDKLTQARNDFDHKNYTEAIAITADVLHAFPDNRDAKIIHDEATKADYELKHPPPPPPPPPKHPWEGVIARYVEGDLTGAVALANACSAQGYGKCRTLLKEMTQFGQMNKRAENLGPRDLKKLLELDRKISGGKTSKLARAAGVRATSMLYQQASAAKAAGQYGKAADYLQQALQINPDDDPASSMLSQIRAKAHDVYLLGYSLKDTNPDDAIARFKEVLQMTRPSDEDHQKAQNWIEKLRQQ